MVTLTWFAGPPSCPHPELAKDERRGVHARCVVSRPNRCDRARTKVALATAFSFAFLTLSVLAALPAAAADKVRVGVLNSGGDLGVFIAREKGYFRDENIEIDTVTFISAAQMIAPLGTGELDAGGGIASAGLYNAADRKIDIRIVGDRGKTAPNFRYQVLAVRKDLVDSGRYKTFADLKGMKIAVPAPGITPQSVLNEAAIKGGIEYADLDQVFLGMPQTVTAFQSRAIDAAIMIEPFTSSAEAMGTMVVVASTEDFYPGAQVSLVFYGEKFARERPDVGRRYMKAHLRAVRDYNDVVDNGQWKNTPKAEEVLRIFSSYTGLTPAQIRATRPQYITPDGVPSIEGMKKDLAFFQKYGMVQSKTITPEQIVDLSFQQAALKELGPYVRRD